MYKGEFKLIVNNFKKLYSTYNKKPFRFLFVVYIIYLVSFFLIDKWPNRDYYIIHSKIDDIIPLYKPAILIYCSWFLMLVLPFIFLLKKKAYNDLWNIAVPMFSAMFISLIIYIFWPTALEIRPEYLSGNDVFTYLLKQIEAIDAPNNVCPSIHVSTSMIIDYQFSKSINMQDDSKRLSRIGFRILNISICISTMLVKQHSIIDVLAGIIMAIVICFLYNKYARLEKG